MKRKKEREKKEVKIQVPMKGCRLAARIHLKEDFFGGGGVEELEPAELRDASKMSGTKINEYKINSR